MSFLISLFLLVAEINLVFFNSDLTVDPNVNAFLSKILLLPMGKRLDSISTGGGFSTELLHRF